MKFLETADANNQICDDTKYKQSHLDPQCRFWHVTSPVGMVEHARWNGYA